MIHNYFNMKEEKEKTLSPAVTVFYIIGVYLSEDREWFGAGNIAVGILTAIVLISFIVKQDLTGFKK